MSIDQRRVPQSERSPKVSSIYQAHEKRMGKTFIDQFLVVYKETSIYIFSLFFIYVNKI